ncbi:hypothetical protein [Sulfobacillus thermosulfidooxidans]|uniref:hypothetical protein n=1 Tax=Sulfobacillus thermosulfidooxidans TaxID=28034 RepID=UPI0006B5F79C|nr:hypothetical protein [Sulfobacillus thermosulfidooxidans]
MHVVILGASGRLGQAVVQTWTNGSQCLPYSSAAGVLGVSSDLITAVTRNPAHVHAIQGVEWAVLDPMDRSSHHALFERADIVIDACNQRYDDWSQYPEMIRVTLEALENTGARYVYIDNIYLYGIPPRDQLVTETVPRRPISQKGAIRFAIETQLVMQMQQGRPIVIVRFPDFYNIVTDSLPRYLRWFGPLDQPHQFIDTSDAARAIRLIAEDDGAYQQIWHVAGDEPITGQTMQGMVQELWGVKVPCRIFGPRFISLLGIINPLARGLKETQYLWTTPVILNTEKFASRYHGHFVIHSHQQVLHAILQARMKDRE